MGKKSLVISSLIIFFLASCSRNVIRRDLKGSQQRSTNAKKEVFSSVRKRIAILPFFNESPYGGDDLSVTATSELRKELSKTGDFIVDSMAARMFGDSKEIYTGGGIKLVQVSRKAKVAGLNFIVFGRITEARIQERRDEIGLIRETSYYSESIIEFKVFDVNSNKEIFTQSIKGHADDKTFRFYDGNKLERATFRRNLLRYSTKIAIRRAIPKIIDLSRKVDWMGRVAKIVGNKIYVNAGRKSGINVGDILKVITEGHEIFDPETGAMIGVSKGTIKGAIEVIDYFGPDGAVCILHSGGSVLEGDFIQLY